MWRHKSVWTTLGYVTGLHGTESACSTMQGITGHAQKNLFTKRAMPAFCIHILQGKHTHKASSPADDL